jgi:hypothetical protein
MFSSTKALLTGVLIAAMVFTLPAPARAEMVGTAQLLAHTSRADQEAQLRQFLARDDVRQQLEAMGVDAQDAQARVAALTDSELQRLSQDVANAPAAGDPDILIILGVVFLVLLILDLVGAIHIFRR